MAGMEPSFVSLPLPWNKQLISILPDKDKLMMFRTCDFWAQQVVQHTTRTTLCLGEQYREGTPPAAAKVESQRRIITHLLAGSRSINIVLQEPDNLPFPSTLCQHMTAIRMDFSAPGRDHLPPLPWDALTNLQYLGIGQKASAMSVAELCQVLEAGHMPRLCKLRVHVELGHAVKHELWKLANAAGTRLLHLTTNSAELLCHLHLFTALQSAEFQWEGLTAGAVSQLCDHPNLKHVTLKECDNLEGFHGHRKCSWETLTLMNCRPLVAYLLPVQDVKEVRILNAIHDTTRQYGMSDRLALASVVARLRTKMSCESLNNTFTLCDAHPGVIPLLGCMRGVQCLHLEAVCECVDGHGGGGGGGGGACPGVDIGSNGPWPGPHIDMQHIGLLYAALPPCIQHITFVSVKNLDWAQLWQCMPGTVHSVSIFNCNVSAVDAVALVQAAPAHIARLDLRESYVTTDRDYVAGNNRRAEDWHAVGLQAMAPAHLTLCLQTPDEARSLAGQVDY